MKEIDINKIWMISDIHFGIRSNSMEWLEIHKTYFNKFFIPLLKEKKENNDVLFILGDIFESRQSINILVLNEALRIFKEIAKIIPIYIVIGNHDCYRKTTTNINSPVILKLLENIKVFEKPDVILTKSGKRLLIMPWEESLEKEEIIVQNNDADYLFCHTHFGGLNYNRKVIIDEGIDFDKVKKFKKVYSGHIHYSQRRQNVEMIGSIMQLTRSDIDNKKRILILDPDTGEEIIYINDYSPQFKKFKIDDILNISHKEFEEKIKNNFVDIIVENNWVSKFPYAQLIDSLSGYNKINYILSSLQKEYEDDDIDIDNINLDNLTEHYIKSLNYSNTLTEKLLDVSGKLYDKAIRYLQEKTLSD